MSALNAEQRKVLSILHDSFAGDALAMRMGQGIADDLRRRLADLDDAAIGRVVLEVANRLAAMVTADDADNPDEAALVPVMQAALLPVAKAFGCGALQLLELEWRHSS